MICKACKATDSDGDDDNDDGFVPEIDLKEDPEPYTEKQKTSAELNEELDVKPSVLGYFPEGYVPFAGKVGKPKETFPCDHCEETFPHKTARLRHLIAVHDIKNGYKCEVCGKSFCHNGTLKFQSRGICTTHQANP
jgi:hypothetical protein